MKVMEGDALFPPDDAVDQSVALTGRISRMLKGQHPAVQGAVLHELTATWLSGFFPASVREDFLQYHIEQVREALAEFAEKQRGQ